MKRSRDYDYICDENEILNKRYLEYNHYLTDQPNKKQCISNIEYIDPFDINDLEKYLNFKIQLFQNPYDFNKQETLNLIDKLKQIIQEYKSNDKTVDNFYNFIIQFDNIYQKLNNKFCLLSKYLLDNNYITLQYYIELFQNNIIINKLILHKYQQIVTLFV